MRPERVQKRDPLDSPLEPKLERRGVIRFQGVIEPPNGWKANVVLTVLQGTSETQLTKADFALWTTQLRVSAFFLNRPLYFHEQWP